MQIFISMTLNLPGHLKLLWKGEPRSSTDKDGTKGDREVFTFLCILEPFNKLFHLLKENALSLGDVSFVVPLQNCLLTQDIR